MTLSLARQLEQMGDQPLPHQVVMSLLKEYSNPNEKIRELVSRGMLLPVRRGLYVAGPELGTQRPEPVLLANHVQGPSYVTAETALSFHGLIPERVFTVVSATVKKSKTFKTPAGIFAYYQLPLPYYSFGLLSTQLKERQYGMIASPLKAIFDRIIFTPYLRVRSVVQASHLLIDDWRTDETLLAKVDVSPAQDWMTDAPKRDSLHYITQAIQQL